MELNDDTLKKAVALFYDGERAPTISAKGVGEQAEEIIRIAEENGVPLCDNGPLVELLSHLELGEEIPQSLYVAVAHIIAFAFKMRSDIAAQTALMPPRPDGHGI